jgi:hypothetical protein
MPIPCLSLECEHPWLANLPSNLYPFVEFGGLVEYCLGRYDSIRGMRVIKAWRPYHMAVVTLDGESTHMLTRSHFDCTIHFLESNSHLYWMREEFDVLEEFPVVRHATICTRICHLALVDVKAPVLGDRTPKSANIRH